MVTRGSEVSASLKRGKASAEVRRAVTDWKTFWGRLYTAELDVGIGARGFQRKRSDHHHFGADQRSSRAARHAGRIFDDALLIERDGAGHFPRGASAQHDRVPRRTRR